MIYPETLSDMEWITTADGSNNEVDIGMITTTFCGLYLTDVHAGFVKVMKLSALKPSQLLGGRELITMNGTRPFEDVVDPHADEHVIMDAIEMAERRMHGMIH